MTIKLFGVELDAIALYGAAVCDAEGKKYSTKLSKTLRKQLMPQHITRS